MCRREAVVTSDQLHRGHHKHAEWGGGLAEWHRGLPRANTPSAETARTFSRNRRFLPRFPASTTCQRGVHCSLHRVAVACCATSLVEAFKAALMSCVRFVVSWPFTGTCSVCGQCTIPVANLTLLLVDVFLLSPLLLSICVYAVTSPPQAVHLWSHRRGRGSFSP